MWSCTKELDIACILESFDHPNIRYDQEMHMVVLALMKGEEDQCCGVIHSDEICSLVLLI